MVQGLVPGRKKANVSTPFQYDLSYLCNQLLPSFAKGEYNKHVNKTLTKISRKNKLEKGTNWKRVDEKIDCYYSTYN